MLICIVYSTRHRKICRRNKFIFWFKNKRPGTPLQECPSKSNVHVSADFCEALQEISELRFHLVPTTATGRQSPRRCPPSTLLLRHLVQHTGGQTFDAAENRPQVFLQPGNRDQLGRIACPQAALDAFLVARDFLRRAAAGLEDALARARREARGAFGDDRLLLERYVERHAREGEAELLAKGLATFEPEALEPVIQAGLDCGIEQSVIDATIEAGL